MNTLKAATGTHTPAPWEISNHAPAGTPDHLTNFRVRVRTSKPATIYTALATSSMCAYAAAADAQGDAPYGITVMPA